MEPFTIFILGNISGLCLGVVVGMALIYLKG